MTTFLVLAKLSRQMMILVLNAPMPIPLTTTMMMMRGQNECLHFSILPWFWQWQQPLALSEEGRRGARKAAEELRRSAQPGRRSESFVDFWSVFAGLVFGIMQKQNSLLQQRPETAVDWKLSVQLMKHLRCCKLTITWQSGKSGLVKKTQPTLNQFGMAQLQLILKVRRSEGQNKQKQPVNTLEKHKDSVRGVAGVPRASNSAISWGS